jgi:hypothetical protein
MNNSSIKIGSGQDNPRIQTPGIVKESAKRAEQIPAKTKTHTHGAGHRAKFGPPHSVGRVVGEPLKFHGSSPRPA